MRQLGAAPATATRSLAAQGNRLQQEPARRRSQGAHILGSTLAGQLAAPRSGSAARDGGRDGRCGVGGGSPLCAVVSGDKGVSQDPLQGVWEQLLEGDADVQEGQVAPGHGAVPLGNAHDHIWLADGEQAGGARLRGTGGKAGVRRRWWESSRAIWVPTLPAACPALHAARCRPQGMRTCSWLNATEPQGMSLLAPGASGLPSSVTGPCARLFRGEERGWSRRAGSILQCVHEGRRHTGMASAHMLAPAYRLADTQIPQL